jgi:hypothetical protein
MALLPRAISRRKDWRRAEPIWGMTWSGRYSSVAPSPSLIDGFKYRRLLRSSIDSSRRRRRQADMRAGFLNDFRDKTIAAQHSSRRIEKHQVGGSVVHLQRCERLQGQREARLPRTVRSPRRSNCSRRVSVAPNALRIQTGGSGGSIR